MSRSATVKGFQLATGSVFLVSYAQLAQKWGMVRLPDVSHWFSAVQHPLGYAYALAVVASGLVAYALSMLCWLGALGQIPLNRAYPFLGLSYCLVYLGGVILPWYQQACTPQAVVGVVLIALGVVLTNARMGSRGH